MVTGLLRLLFLFSGWLCILLGVIGIFLPVLPTTPFILLAAYFFSKSSEALHGWLINQKTLGPIIVNWERYGVIRPRAKTLSTLLITGLGSYTMIMVKTSLLIKSSVAITLGSVLVFIWTRPSRPTDSPKNMLP